MKKHGSASLTVLALQMQKALNLLLQLIEEASVLIEMSYNVALGLLMRMKRHMIR